MISRKKTSWKVLELSFFKRLRDLSALFLFNSHNSAYENHISVDVINRTILLKIKENEIKAILV